MDSELERIKTLYQKEKKSLREIGQLTGRDHHWVARRLRCMGIEIKKYNKPLKKKRCEVCGKLFTPKRASRRFCSHKCRGKAKELGLFTRKNEHPIVTRICPHCKTEFKCRDYSVQKYCSRRCFDLAHSKNMAGENNPSYINGNSLNSPTFRGSGWNIIRQDIYERDNFICQICGAKCISRANVTPETTWKIIQCHHIRLYNSGTDNNSNNLITLCLRCHRTLHIKQKNKR